TAPVDMASNTTKKILGVTRSPPSAPRSKVSDPAGISERRANRRQVAAFEHVRGRAQRVSGAGLAHRVGDAHRDVLHHARVAEAIDRASCAAIAGVSALVEGEDGAHGR